MCPLSGCSLFLLPPGPGKHQSDFRLCGLAQCGRFARMESALSTPQAWPVETRSLTSSRPWVSVGHRPSTCPAHPCTCPRVLA